MLRALVAATLLLASAPAVACVMAPAPQRAAGESAEAFAARYAAYEAHRDRPLEQIELDTQAHEFDLADTVYIARRSGR